jgi:hypothetical protein
MGVGQVNTSTQARDLVCGLIDRFLASPEVAAQSIETARQALPEEVVLRLDRVLSDKRLSYRDGVLIQFSFGIVDGTLDLTVRPEGSRGLAPVLGAFLADRHIPFVKDAYQNIAKNTDKMARGNVPDFDALLVWGTGATGVERQAVLHLACARVAATARQVLPMPRLNRSLLTFARTTDLILRLLDQPSGGAYEQFVIAALLYSLAQGHAQPFRIETKSLNASDKSSYAAGDIQIVTGNRVIEAIEVTAKSWRTKLADASKTIRDNDLSRLHVIAARPDQDRSLAISNLSELPEDVAVLDIRQVADVLVAVLTKPQRADALQRLYECLDRYQSDTQRVNEYVRRLGEAGLVESAGD